EDVLQGPRRHCSAPCLLREEPTLPRKERAGVDDEGARPQSMPLGERADEIASFVVTETEQEIAQPARVDEGLRGKARKRILELAVAEKQDVGFFHITHGLGFETVEQGPVLE